tara:strand:+ start:449 stop:1987 length:1539 start_codon:yes stop_codon:yes gene_type:complete
MQPFPTAFWKKDNAVNLEDSCIQFENTEDDLAAGTSEQILAHVLPSTPSKSETEEGAIGLYKDTFQIKSNYALTFRYSNINHPVFGYHSIGGTEDAFYEWSSASVGGNFRQSDFHMPYARTKKHENDQGEEFLSTSDHIAGDLDNGYYFEESDVFDSNDGYANVMSKHWLDVWMGSANGTHKTNPITMFSDCENNKATIKCYFEKDAAQRFSEMLDNNLTDGDFPDSGGDQSDILRAVRKRGFNGYYSGYNDEPQFFYRQRGKVRAKLSLGSEKTVRIKIKGLGMDDNLGFNLSVNPFSQALRNPSDDNTDTRKLDGQLVFDLFNPAVHSFNDEGGGCDLQTCKIFIDGEEKIKCTAPQIGYYNYTELSSDLNYYKAPVRIFELISETTTAEGQTVLNYGRTGLDENERGVEYHQIQGLEYIPKSEFTDGKFVVTAAGDAVNPYGNNWTSNQSYFYDAFSNMVAPDYHSPYEFSKDYTLSAGEHKIDMLFDTIANYFNGGAYYEINIEIIDS